LDSNELETMKSINRITALSLCIALLCFPGLLAFAQSPPPPATAEQAAKLHALIESSPKLALKETTFKVQVPAPETATDYISSAIANPDGTTHIFHRNPRLDPILLLDANGKVLKSWGKGLFENPHSIRRDAEGNIWTVDSRSSVVIKFSPEGKQLLQFKVPLPTTGRPRGAADIALAPGGRIFIADGYGNARVVEYNAQGEKVREWGSPGTKPGQLHLPHGITYREGVLYVADRENGRIQRFDLDGKYLGEWDQFGKTFSISTGPDGNLWLGTHPRNVPNEDGGWIVKVDPETGKVLGYIESPGLHSLDITAAGEVVTGSRIRPDEVFWYRPVR
jgi:streptogramin lyase